MPGQDEPALIRAAGYEQAIATLRAVARRTGSPMAQWGADYLDTDPDRLAPRTDVPTLSARAIEGPRGSGLCDCDGIDSEPTSPRDGSKMDHHCECRAVTTAAVLIGAYSKTIHARQCGHGTEHDEFYR